MKKTNRTSIEWMLRKLPNRWPIGDRGAIVVRDREAVVVAGAGGVEAAAAVTTAAVAVMVDRVAMAADTEEEDRVGLWIVDVD